VRHVLAWLAAWVALFWLWLLLAGEWNRQEWIAAASAAAVAATVGEVARTRTGVHPRVPWGRLAEVRTVPLMVVVDFGIVVWALAVSLLRREIVRGAFRSHDFPAGGDDPHSAAVRTWVGLLATYSPNAYVVDLEPERGLSLVHDLVPYRPSEHPA
jgi:multisubunit Na+/H+ antiporter MnhE subunit